MDSHPKKRKTNTEQIRNQSTVTSLAEKAKYSPYKAKANQTPLPNTAIQICLLKKKKNPQYRENQTPDPEQTKPTVRRRRSRCSQAQLAPSLVVLVYLSSTCCSSAPRRHSSRGPRRRSLQIADRRSVLGCSQWRCHIQVRVFPRTP